MKSKMITRILRVFINEKYFPANYNIFCFLFFFRFVFFRFVFFLFCFFSYVVEDYVIDWINGIEDIPLPPAPAGANPVVPAPLPMVGDRLEYYNIDQHEWINVAQPSPPEPNPNPNPNPVDPPAPPRSPSLFDYDSFEYYDMDQHAIVNVIFRRNEAESIGGEWENEPLVRVQHLPRRNSVEDSGQSDSSDGDDPIQIDNDEDDNESLATTVSFEYIENPNYNPANNPRRIADTDSEDSGDEEFPVVNELVDIDDDNEEQPDPIKCGVCRYYVENRQPYALMCGHIFCLFCIVGTYNAQRKASCPLCREPIAKKKHIRKLVF